MRIPLENKAIIDKLNARYKNKHHLHVLRHQINELTKNIDSELSFSYSDTPVKLEETYKLSISETMTLEIKSQVYGVGHSYRAPVRDPQTMKQFNKTVKSVREHVPQAGEAAVQKFLDLLGRNFSERYQFETVEDEGEFYFIFHNGQHRHSLELAFVSH